MQYKTERVKQTLKIGFNYIYIRTGMGQVQELSVGHKLDPYNFREIKKTSVLLAVYKKTKTTKI